MMLRRKLFSWLKLWLVQLEKLKYGVIFDYGLEKLEKNIIVIAFGWKSWIF